MLVPTPASKTPSHTSRAATALQPALAQRGLAQLGRAGGRCDGRSAQEGRPGRRGLAGRVVLGSLCGLLWVPVLVPLTAMSASAQRRQVAPPPVGTPLSASEFASLPAPPEAPTPAAESDEDRILAAINDLRAAASLRPLEEHDGLMRAAQQHSAEMAQARALSHVSPTSGTPADRASAAGVQALRVTQNISLRPTALEAHRAILASEAHRAQVMDPEATHIGVGLADGPDGVYLTEVMARLVPPPAQPALPPPSVTDVPQPSVGSPSPSGPSTQAPSSAAPSSAPAPQSPAAPGPTTSPATSPANPSTASNPAAVAAAAAAASVPSSAAAPTSLPSLRLTRAHRGVAGYWLFHQGRWWYFPVPPGSRPGQLLYPDVRVQGTPPGYQPTPAQPQTPARVQPVPTTTAPRGYWRLTPQ